MASADWIKMRTELYRHPKVICMARNVAEHLEKHCHVTVRDITVTRHAVVGALVAVWGTARHRGNRAGSDLLIPNMPASIVDDISALPGLGAAMIACGWLIEMPQALVFPRFFDEHNIDPLEDRRAADRERQRRHRASKHGAEVSQDSHVTVTRKCHARERERERDNTPQPPQGEFERFWSSWPSHHRKRDRKQCAELWRREKLDRITDAILRSLEAWKQSEEWRRENGRFIPGPIVWLRGQRWEAPINGNGHATEDEVESMRREAASRRAAIERNGHG